MLKIKIPLKSEDSEENQKPLTKHQTPTAKFWTWWQKGFAEPEDLMEFDVGDFQTAVQLSSVVENYVWPDFKVCVEGTWIVFRRVREKYYPRKKNKQPGLINAAWQDKQKSLKTCSYEVLSDTYSYSVDAVIAVLWKFYCIQAHQTNHPDSPCKQMLKNAEF